MQVCRIAAVAAAVALVVGCDFPRDAGGTLARVQNDGVLRVGYSERPPWVILENGRPAGIEPRLVEAWASELGAEVEWVGGSESSLVEALHARQIAVLIGGHLSDTGWTRRAAISSTYAEANLVIAGPDATVAEGNEDDLAGKTIAYRPARPDFAALIAGLGAHPQAADDWRTRVAVAYDFETVAAEPSSAIVKKEEHVLLVTQGESALLFALGRFLSGNGRRFVEAR